ncbi:hypothetical protein J3A64_004758 [Pseudarthrobacter sp. PvP004]|uniref:hypothetical protein n=1 Tax=Pseudarthrobacter sp. PvP004 TaxID=2817850 RepID=UPI001AE1DCA1|nr:hypothetical protein [Pseudarthrobacter sp. PvP004]MBP2269218.1 hypothetical protein [Pseudarthrobacter sp. PvP004]
MTNFWNEDGDFDYEAQVESIDREKAAVTAERAEYPGMTDAFHRFGLYGGVADEVITAELLDAMDRWQVLLEKAENTEDDVDRKKLEREHETLERAIHDMIGD